MKKRPFSVTILLWLVLSLTAWSGLRLATAIQWWSTLQTYAARPGALYIAVSAGVWLIASLTLLWGIWRRKAWERLALIGAAAGFLVWYWCDRLFLQFPSSNWVFALIATILLLFVTILCAVLPGTKTFFEERGS